MLLTLPDIPRTHRTEYISTTKVMQFDKMERHFEFRLRFNRHNGTSSWRQSPGETNNGVTLQGETPGMPGR